jgi:hypothetical protein
MNDMCLIYGSREYLKECLPSVTELRAKLKITASMKKTRIVKLKGRMDFFFNYKGKYVFLESGKSSGCPAGIPQSGCAGSRGVRRGV